MRLKMITRGDQIMWLSIGLPYIGFCIEEDHVDPEGNYHLLEIEDVLNMISALELAVKIVKAKECA